MKIQNISKYAMLCVIGVSVLVFLLFFLIGWEDSYEGDFNVPYFTSLLLVWMYLTVAVTAALTVWAVVKGVQSTKGNDPAATTGVPGGKVILGTIALLVVSLIPGLVIGFGESEFTAADGTVTSAAGVMVVDIFIWSIYILTIAAVAAVGVSMSGILTKSASK